jgi:hypothetical protein
MPLAQKRSALLPPVPAVGVDETLGEVTDRVDALLE